VIESDELVADPQGVLARVEAYFGLPASGLAEPRRERWIEEDARCLGGVSRGGPPGEMTCVRPRLAADG
jgi:hypothetical protein